MRATSPVDNMDSYGSNEELAAALARAEETAFEVFSRSYGPRLRSYLLAHGLPAAEAEPLAVSLVTDISLKAPRFQVERGGVFDSWVFTLARNGLADWWRQRCRNTAHEQFSWEPFYELDIPLEPVTRKDLIDAVDQALAKIPELDQEILRRRDMDSQQSYEEIATELKLRPGTARVRRLRALRKLEQHLRADSRVQHFLERLQPASSRRK